MKHGFTLLDAAGVITSFADGICDPYDWDEFTSTPFDNPEIQKVVQECLRVEIDFPPRHDREWCSPEGGQTLLKIAKRIRRKVQQ